MASVPQSLFVTVQNMHGQHTFDNNIEIFRDCAVERIRLFDHGMVYNFGPVCLSVCQTITFESLNERSSHLHTQYISTEYWCRFVCEGHRKKEIRRSIFPR